MLAFAPSVLLFVLFCISAREDRRRFRNAVYLGLTCISLSVALLAQLRHLPGGIGPLVALMVFAVPALGVVALALFLIANGVTMVRKEGRSFGNLLSLLAGLGIVALLVLMVTAVSVGSAGATGPVVTVVLLALYVSFLFLCFLGYAFLYGRIKVRGDVDFVVMLGSGLIGGDRVPPLLASRLRRGREIYEAQTARGGPAPVLLTSGGKGSDEQVAEARAMADWLIAEGVPAEHVRLEDRSRTTEENLRFSERIMAGAVPGYRCVVVTNNFHAFRAAMMARKARVNGQVLGSPTAAYFWPSATIREFVAVFMEHKVVNLAICGALVVLGVLLTLATV
ncbi:YdcF family protein [Streptomyces sp. NBC_00536]|uniref:YdcF family protein n=1 Tax=Streptomyces sp. NBC_00536 TaxID=2975769 RepID=UPI002E80D23D|nr:YdcF family protein [Streptomyces sp. NBC_00536]WUC80994.1 YdcF family protein [Streptomyces sp. NBC_00536]